MCNPIRLFFAYGGRVEMKKARMGHNPIPAGGDVTLGTSPQV